jgi:hypothetical protein
MTEPRGTGRSTDNEDALVAFHAEVARLLELDRGTFAELDAGDLEPIVATIRATPSQVTRS